MRWVSVGPPSQPDVQIVLEPPAGDPGASPSDKQAIEDLMAKGLLGRLVFATDDCDATVEHIRAAGAEVMQGPIDMPYGVRDCAFRLPSIILEESKMQARTKNPAMIIPEAMKAIQALNPATEKGGVPSATLALAHLRASQINGCSSCVHSGTGQARKAGETDDRLATVAAWRDIPFFTDAERAALALTEALVLVIATTNVFNRLNITTRQVAGAWG